MNKKIYMITVDGIDGYGFNISERHFAPNKKTANAIAKSIHWCWHESDMNQKSNSYSVTIQLINKEYWKHLGYPSIEPSI